jgi:RNA polymerase sigma-70 factor (ECF subfamily)
MTEKSDAELAQQISSSNSIAFKSVYDRYSEILFHYIWSRVDCTNIAEEMVQEVFVRLWHSREKLETKKTLKPYLFRIANNLIVDYFRKQKVRNRFIEEEKQKTNIEASEDIELKTRLNIAIKKLPEKYRTVFILHHIKEYEYKEIAQVCHVSVKTVENRMKRAIYLLQKDLIS